MPKSGVRIALDSTVAIAVLNDRDGYGSWVQRFTAIFLPVPVVGELRFGAVQSKRSSENLRRIDDLISRSQVLDVRLATTEVYARLRLALKKKGKPIPENDLWIAAICVENALPLATDDGHFAEVEELSLDRPSV
jgi:tRNA(fMet)-specific endonuclease VapC